MPELKDRPASRLGKWLAELRRRRVPRVAAAYLIVGWAVVEVADTVFPYLGLPEAAVTLVIALVALGLPLALVLSWAFELTPEGVRRDERPEPGPAEPARRSRWSLPLLALVLGSLLAGGLAWWHRAAPGADDPAMDPGAVAVLPFRVAGAAAELAHLEEGLADLMAITLSGEAGPRALDPRAVLSAWAAVSGDGTAYEEAVGEVGRRLGAGRMVRGEVVGQPGRLTLSASLTETATGVERARARAEGPLDSLPSLVDELTAELIILDRGEDPNRLTALTSTSLPALMNYLEGRRAYRGAEYEIALRHFSAALDRDSTFALAAIGMLDAVAWVLSPPPEAEKRAVESAWRERDRLSERDRSYLVGLLGPEYPAPSSERSRIEAWERAAQESPGRPEVWYSLGDRYFHFGALTGVPDWRSRSGAAFRRALALDSTWNAPLQHLIDLAFLGDDAAETARLTELYLNRDSTGVWPDFVRYQRAQARGDTTTARRAIESLQGEPVVFLSSTGDEHRLVAPEMGARALAVMEADAATTDQLREVQVLRHHHALNRGWPDTAAAALSAMRRLDPDDHTPLRMAIGAALYWDGRLEHAEEAAARLEDAVAGDRPTGESELDEWRRDLCVVGQWRAARGDVGGAETAADRLRSTRLERGTGAFRSEEGLWRDEICATLLETMAADAAGRRDEAGAFADRLDELLLEGPPVEELRRQGNYVLIGLLEQQGRLEDAIAITDRFVRLPGTEFYHSSFLRERGRLQARAGQTEAAARSLQGYLALRRAGSPDVQDDLERARQLLRELGGAG